MQSHQSVVITTLKGTKVVTSNYESLIYQIQEKINCQMVMCYELQFLAPNVYMSNIQGIDHCRNRLPKSITDMSDDNTKHQKLITSEFRASFVVEK